MKRKSRPLRDGFKTATSGGVLKKGMGSVGKKTPLRDGYEYIMDKAVLKKGYDKMNAPDFDFGDMGDFGKAFSGKKGKKMGYGY